MVLSLAKYRNERVCSRRVYQNRKSDFHQTCQNRVLLLLAVIKVTPAGIRDMDYLFA